MARPSYNKTPLPVKEALFAGSISGRKGYVNMDCLFCKIAGGEIPSTTIYEDDDVRVILDISPAAHGHALILPKKHAASLLEADDAMIAKVYTIARDLGRRMISELGAEGVNVLANCKEAAGQTIDHFHVHVIPRYPDNADKDGLIISQNEIVKPDFEAIASALRFN